MSVPSLLSSGRLIRSSDTKKEAEEKTDNKTDASKDADNDDADDVEAEPNDGDATAVKEQQRQLDTQEYDGEEEESQEVVKEDEEETGENSNMDGNADKDSADGGKKEEDEDDEENSSDEETSRKEEPSKEDKDLITQALSHTFIDVFKFDEKKHRWCTVTFRYKQSHLQLDMKLLLEKTIKSAVLQHVKGINRAFLSEENENGEMVLHVKTEGVNIQEMFKYPDVLDLNRLYSNCIHTMAGTYGVEAANRVIIKVRAS